MLPEHLDMVNCYLFTVPDEAVATWPVEAIIMILEKMLARDISRRNDSGWKTLYMAATRGREEAVPTLLTYMKEKDIWQLTSESSQETALHVSARKNFYGIVQALVTIGDALQLTTRDGTGQTALHHAATVGHAEIVRGLPQKTDQDGICESDYLGETALIRLLEIEIGQSSVCS